MSTLQTYQSNFTLADMTARSKTFTHSLDLSMPEVIVYDENFKPVSNSNYTLENIDSNNLKLTMFWDFADTYSIVVSAGKITTAGYMGSRIEGDRKVHYFTNSDLVAGILTVNHAFGTVRLNINVWNNVRKLEINDNFVPTPDGIDSVKIDLSGFGTIAGTWVAIIRKW